jgi:hypothetical protein
MGSLQQARASILSLPLNDQTPSLLSVTQWQLSNMSSGSLTRRGAAVWGNPFSRRHGFRQRGEITAGRCTRSIACGPDVDSRGVWLELFGYSRRAVSNLRDLSRCPRAVAILRRISCFNQQILNCFAHGARKSLRVVAKLGRSQKLQVEFV